MKFTRVVVIDDHELFREGVRSVLAHHEHIRVVAQASSCAGGREILARVACDVVLLSLESDPCCSCECVRKLKACYPKLRVLVVATRMDATHLMDVLNSGADGCLVKNTSRDELVAAIRGIGEGAIYLHPLVAGVLVGVLRKPPNPVSRSVDLTEREHQVLDLMCAGRSNSNIGEALHLAENTVKVHVKSLYRKLDVNDRSGAVVRAIESGLTAPVVRETSLHLSR